MRLHVAHLGRLHIPVESPLGIRFHALAVIVALADVEATVDVAQLCCLHIPLEGNLQVNLHARAALVAHPQVVHRPGVALISFLAVGIGLIPFLRHACPFFILTAKIRKIPAITK